MNEGLNTDFQRLTQGFPELLGRLRRDTYPSGMSRTIPKRGVYAFRDGAVTWYVGRTDKMGRRWTQHVGAGCNENQASFAFLLARDEARKARIWARTRKALARDGRFKPFFGSAKARIREMSRHAVEIVDPQKQALFEIYAAVALRAKYCDFRNH